MSPNNNLPPGSKAIQLSGKNGRGVCAIVDSDDYESLIKYHWFLNRGYVVRTEHYQKENGPKTTRTIYMHREIMSPPADMQVDHKNHNRLDNRKNNLRICTALENMKNKVYKGYYYSSIDNRWVVNLKVDGKWKKRSFLTEEEAKQGAKLAKSGKVLDKKTGHRNKFLPKYISRNVCKGKLCGYYFRCTIDGETHKMYGFQSLADAIIYRDNFFNNRNIKSLERGISE